MIIGPDGLSRIEPSGPPGAYQTFQIAAPRSSHFKKATCEQFGCPAWQSGWATVLPKGDDRAYYIRHHSGRRFTETWDETTVTFTFPPGQVCFGAADHRVRLDRPELYVVRDGDWRGNLSGTRPVRLRADQWQDDFATNQDKLNQARERG